MVSAINEQVYKSEEFINLISGRCDIDKPVFRRFTNENVNIESVAIQATSIIHSSNINENNLSLIQSYNTFDPVSEHDNTNIDKEETKLENVNIDCQTIYNSADCILKESSPPGLISNDKDFDTHNLYEIKEIDGENMNSDLVVLSNLKSKKVNKLVCIGEYNDIILEQEQNLEPSLKKKTDDYVLQPEDTNLYENADTTKYKRNKNNNNSFNFIRLDKNNSKETYDIIKKNENMLGMEIKPSYNETKDQKICKESEEFQPNARNDDRQNFDNTINNEKKKNQIRDENLIKTQVTNETRLVKEKKVTTLGKNVNKVKSVNSNVVGNSTKSDKVLSEKNNTEEPVSLQIQIERESNRLYNRDVYVYSGANTETVEVTSLSFTELNEEEIKLKKILNEMALDSEDESINNCILCDRKDTKSKNLTSENASEKYRGKVNNECNTTEQKVDGLKEVSSIGDTSNNIKTAINDVNPELCEHQNDETSRGCFSGILHYFKNFFQ